MSGRDCSFASQTPAVNLSISGTSSHERPISATHSDSQGGVVILAAAFMSNTDSSKCPSIDNQQDRTLDDLDAINANHIELLLNLVFHKEIFNPSGGVGDYSSNISFALKTGLKSPYLLHQLLAFSARHLAFQHPESSASYLHQAVTLQTRAVSLFNAAWTEVDQSNCVAIFIFSVILGHHLLADTLAKRDKGGLEEFIGQYIQCVVMQRGIYTIARTAWPFLMESELEPILLQSTGFTSRPPRGNHCQRITDLVEGTDGLGEVDKEACRQAIQYLQVGFDAVLTEDGAEEVNRYQMVYLWTLVVPSEFTSLLAARKPEALVLLGYYALLLHYGRRMWQVGDAGVYLLGIIVDYLGPEWDHWLDYPREKAHGEKS